ncbi:hypothetical protein BIW11_04155 [Tropilaelaps mercedesae]|uniref:Uncharacterized protein n=1 Tax=Tropilaelaps mercedesae TaxID=418985 RepID=A0A1V9XAQ3_9ACAR|nr:hypothetical protein BIW11_04155 [Tropilaelaps mercedesae]
MRAGGRSNGAVAPARGAGTSGGVRGGISEIALQKLDRAKQELGAAKDSLSENAHELRKEKLQLSVQTETTLVDQTFEKCRTRMADAKGALHIQLEAIYRDTHLAFTQRWLKVSSPVGWLNHVPFATGKIPELVPMSAVVLAAHTQGMFFKGPISIKPEIALRKASKAAKGPQPPAACQDGNRLLTSCDFFDSNVCYHVSNWDERSLVFAYIGSDPAQFRRFETLEKYKYEYGVAHPKTAPMEERSFHLSDKKGRITELSTASKTHSSYAYCALIEDVLFSDLEYALGRKLEQDLWNMAFHAAISALQKEAHASKEGALKLGLMIDLSSGYFLQLLQRLVQRYRVTELKERSHVDQQNLLGIYRGVQFSPCHPNAIGSYH